MGGTMKKVLVSVVEDDRFLRESMCRLMRSLGYTADIFPSAADFLASPRLAETACLITDIHMPPTQTQEGVRAAIEIRHRFPSVGILLLSSYVERGEVIELFAATASGVGYLLKDSVANVDQLLDALERISEGGIVLDPKLVFELIGQLERPDPLDALTAREREVVELMAQGRSNTAIANSLWVTEGAVEKHVKHIFNKLEIPVAPDTHRRVLAVLTFLDAR